MDSAERLPALVFRNEELLEAAEVLAENKEMRVALRGSSKSAFITGCTTLFGGFLAGPAGLALGGCIGGVGSSVYHMRRLKPVVDVIRNYLSDGEKTKLIDCLRRAVSGVQVSDIISLAVVVLQSGPLQAAIEKALKNFFLKTLGRRIRQPPN